MASRNILLPTKEQCLALTDEQCRMIQDCLDPDETRFQKDWEKKHQPELVRLYMTMMSFNQIEQAMRSKLNWSYKTYQNRFRDWFFPLDRVQREQKIIELYGLVTGSSFSSPSATAPPPTPPRFLLPLRPNVQTQPTHQSDQFQLPPPSFQDFQFFPTIADQREVNMSGTPDIVSASTPTFVPAVTNDDSVSISSISKIPNQPDVPFFPDIMDQGEVSRSRQDRASISTTRTFASESGDSVSTFYDEVFSNPRFSIATTNSSLSALSQYSSSSRSQSVLPRKMLKPPKHDARAGYWNSALRVIPCGRDHSNMKWDVVFATCELCGFSRLHALMVHARGIDIGTFIAAMKHMSHIARVDLAGNYPIHFLMIAGVGMKYFSELFQWQDLPAQNSFGQNPLHVLNPQDLGDKLPGFLEWWINKSPPGIRPGFLLTQRDIFGRTPLHTLLRHPLEREMYRKVLEIFPYSAHQLRSLDIAGRTTIKMMTEASLKLRAESEADYAKLQAGITEVKVFLAETEGTYGSGKDKYGFHDIARGARGTSYFGFYHCRICDRTNAHTNSYVDQMKCACYNGRDRNAPDDTGMTPAHALLILGRHNDKDGKSTPETPTQTAELFSILIPYDDPTLREALHVLDPDGNSLIYNIAIRGFDEILQYVLNLESPERHLSMVNTCNKGLHGKEVSVLEAVITKLRELGAVIEQTNYLAQGQRSRDRLNEQALRLMKCKSILIRAGAEMKPSMTTRWRIIF